MSEPIRVFIVDDHPIVRRGIADLLETEPGMRVVGEAVDGEQALRGVAESQPDIVLMDLVMPVMDGIEATRRIKAEHAQVGILVLTSFATDDKVFPAIKAGALGYLIKDTSPEELIHAIQDVHAGRLALHPDIAQKLLSELSEERPARDVQVLPAEDQLTTRELEVLRLVARGMNNQEIAEQLVISVATVYTHVSKILAKLHLASRTQAALYALREGLASLDEANPEPGEFLGGDSLDPT